MSILKYKDYSSHNKKYILLIYMEKSVIIVVVVLLIIVLLIIVMKKKKSKWTKEQVESVKRVLDGMILCPDSNKDKEMAKCALQKLQMHSYNDIATDLSKDMPELVHNAIADCFKDKKCALPMWSPEQEQDIIVKLSQSPMLPQCANPSVNMNRSQCIVGKYKSLLNHEQFSDILNNKNTLPEKVNNALALYLDECIKNIPCA
jgi:hypothetical protein